jgi:SNF2 family DNA or RNA helicase
VLDGEPELQAVDCRGGLFCDEPGLGKTITALAIVLKTLGQQAKPPLGNECDVLEEPDTDDDDDERGLCGDGDGDDDNDDDVPLAFLSRRSVSDVAGTAANGTPSTKPDADGDDDELGLCDDGDGDDDDDDDVPLAFLSRRSASDVAGTAANGTPSTTPMQQAVPPAGSGDVLTEDGTVVASGRVERGGIVESRGTDIIFVGGDVYASAPALASASSPTSPVPAGRSNSNTGLGDVWETDEPIPVSASTEHWGTAVQGTRGVQSSESARRRHLGTPLEQAAPVSQKRGLKKRPMRRLYYCPSRVERFLPFGVEDLQSRSRSHRNGTEPRRAVRKPEFFSKTMGEGSVPNVSFRNVPIYLSGATLVIVPDILVKHWEDQIMRHVQPNALRVLVIRSAQDAPSSIEIAFDYDLVLISFRVLNHLYRGMRVEAPALLCVRFLRVIMDEGHKLGISATSLTDFSRVSDGLNAERRWIMTGTPTPSKSSNAVRTLQPLLRFIRDAALGYDRHAWSRGIQRPYEAAKPEALYVLDRLLTRVMIRSSKTDLQNLPDCIVKDVVLEFSEDAAASYNDLVLLARRNMVLSDWFDPTHKESLLNPKNRQECGEFLGNMRSACNFGGVIRMEFDLTDLGETLDLLYNHALQNRTGLLAKVQPEDMVLITPSREKWFSSAEYRPSEAFLNSGRRVSPAALEALGLTNVLPTPLGASGAQIGPPESSLSVSTNGGAGPSDPRRAAGSQVYDVNVVDEVEKPLSLPRKGAPGSRIEFRGAVKEIGKLLLKGCVCPTCNVFCRLPIVSTCGHTVCLDCFISSRLGCTVPSCGHRYVMDKKNVPAEVQELQPSVTNDKWKAEWEKSVSAKVEYIFRRLDEIDNLPTRTVWKNGKWRHQLPKVIIFSQFHMHHLLLQLRFQESKRKDSYIELFANEAEKEKEYMRGGRKRETGDERASRMLQRFIHDETIQVLLLEAQHGSVGLDLSFVEYVFLLEPVWDLSVEKQVIARAHRIGAKESVHVERLAMADSIEHDILKQNAAMSSDNPDPDRKDADFARRATLLRNVQMVTFEAMKKPDSTPASTVPDSSPQGSSPTVSQESTEIVARGMHQGIVDGPVGSVFLAPVEHCTDPAPPLIHSHPPRVLTPSRRYLPSGHRRNRFDSEMLSSNGFSLFGGASIPATGFIHADDDDDDDDDDVVVAGAEIQPAEPPRKRVRFA